MSLSRFAAGSLLLAAVVATAAEPKPTVVYTGHADPVYAVAVSPDGTLAATGSFDKSIKLWDAATGKVVRTLAGPKGHESLVLSVAFSPAGDVLASGGADNTVRLWDVPSRKPVKELALGAEVRKVAVSADGKLIAAGGAGGKLRVWPTEGDQPRELTGHGGTIHDLAFSGNGQTLVSVAADRRLRFWNTATGEPTAIVGVGPIAAEGAVFHNGTNTVLTNGADGVVRAWTPPTPRTKPVMGEASLLAVSADGKTGLVAHKGGVRWLMLQTLQEVKPIADAPKNATALAVGGVIAAGTESGELIVWNTDGKTVLKTLAGGNPIRSVAVQPGKPVAMTAGDDGRVRLFAVPVKLDDKPVKPTSEFVADAAGVVAAEFDASGRVVTVGVGGEVKTWDVTTGKEARTLGKLSAKPTAFALRRGGQQVAVASGKTIKLWQTSDGKELPCPALPFDVTSLAFVPDQPKLLVGSADKTASVLDLSTGLIEQSVPHSSAVKAVAAVGTNQVLVVGDDGQAVVQPLAVVRVYKPEADTRGRMQIIPNSNSIVFAADGSVPTVRNVGNGNRERTLDAVGPVRRLAFSKTGDQLAATDGKIPEIELVTNDGRPIGTIKTAAPATEVAFHPNGQSLAASLADKSVVTWNVVAQPGQPAPPEFGSMTQTFPHPAVVSSLAFIGDGTKLVTGAADGIVRVWRVAAESPTKSIPHPNLVDAVAFDPTGTRLATACHDGNLRIFDVAKAAVLKQVAAHTSPQPNPVYAVAWTPDGKSVVTAGFDQSIKIWDATEGKLVREIRPASALPPSAGHRDQVFAVAVSADGKRLASGSSDHTVKLWELDTGKLLRDFPNPDLPASKVGPTPSHPGFVHAVRFAAKDTKLVSVGTAPKGRGYLAVWSVADGKKLAGGDVPFGPIYSLAGFENGDLLLGCGPVSRGRTESNAVRVPLP